MEAPTLSMSFVRGDAGADKIQATVDEVLAELIDPSSEAVRAAGQAGLDVRGLADARVTVREGGQGADPFLTPILVGIAVSAGSKVAETLWKEVLWPRLRRRLGVGVLGDAKDESRRAES